MFRRLAGVVFAGLLAVPLVVAARPSPVAAAAGVHAVQRTVERLGSVDLGALAAQPHPATAPTPVNSSFRVEVDRRRDLLGLAGVNARTIAPKVTAGIGAAPPSSLSTSPGSAVGFEGLGLKDMEAAGTGTYAGTNGGLEPPDQMVCVGNGFVMEGVNTAITVYSPTGHQLTTPVPLTQFFNINPAGLTQPMPSFTSDPRCIWDAATRRFFVLTLEIDESNGAAAVPFVRSHTYFAVSKTSDPTKGWNLYGFDVTDDGTMGTPLHPSCPCLDDQPLMGTNADGFYISANEYSDSEVLPVATPVNPPFGTLPDFRNGQAQVYAISKSAVVNGASSFTLNSFDTQNTPLPSDAPSGSTWSSLQPSWSPPGDLSPAYAGDAEFFLSSLDFASTGDNRVAVWAVTNASTLSSSTPNVQLSAPAVITTLNPADTYLSPFGQSDTGVDQKIGPHPGCAGCGLEQLNANDDRMNEVMLTNGALWGGVNTIAPARAAGTDSGQTGNRNGIMYFQVIPAVDAAGKVTATMARDGYVNVPNESVLFPSIGATAAGKVLMTFTVVGQEYYPSAAWTELDGLNGAAPAVNISAPGTGPEDGFTGYGPCGSFGLSGLLPGPCTPSGPNVARWGDYTFSVVDEAGCVWAATEYIPGNQADNFNSGNWGTYVQKLTPAGGCVPAPAAVVTTPVPTATPTLPVAAAVPAQVTTPNTSRVPASAAAAAVALLLVAGAVVVARRRRLTRGD